MEKYQQNGQEIFDRYCRPVVTTPTMLPRAPDQTYVDVYPEKDQPGCSFADERKRQSDYEAEVMVYRGLAGLKENLIVLHSLQYTHDQYCLCVESHNRDKRRCKGCKNPFNKDGECDFLVLGPEYCVIMEVKNIMLDGGYKPNDPKLTKALLGTFRKSVEQREKISSLIKGIDKEATILTFTVYPNFSKKFKYQFQSCEKTALPLTDTELSTIVFQEDISGRPNSKQNLLLRIFSSLTGCFNKTININDEDSTLNHENKSSFSFWWEENVTQMVVPPEENESSAAASRHEKVRNVLLAIHCTEKKICDQSKCSLQWCIANIDKRLKEGHITFLPKNGKKRAENPRIVEAPDAIKNYIGVHYLTSKQNSVFNSKEKLLFINGPAGAGKSITLCGHIIELAKSDNNNKVVLFRFTGEGNSSKLYQGALDKADIKYQEVDYDLDTTLDRVIDLIEESEGNVIIVEMICVRFDDIIYILRAIKNCNICIDDIQKLLYFIQPDECRALIEKLSEISLQYTVRIVCDLVQGMLYSDTNYVIDIVSVITEKLSETQLVCLSRNLRNTQNISAILCLIRNQFVELYSSRMHVLDTILPKQIPGHFIHGPEIFLHILDNYDVNMISNILDNELDRLSDNLNILSNSDIGIVHSDFGEIWPLLKETVDKRRKDADETIAVCYSTRSYSAEWPAVVVLHMMYGHSTVWELPRLYLAISRARVNCSVVLYPCEGETLDNCTVVLELLDKLRCHVNIIRH